MKTTNLYIIDGLYLFFVLSACQPVYEACFGASELASVLAFLPGACLDLPIFEYHPALAPGVVTPELPLVLVAVLEVHFPEALHLAGLELADILDPVDVVEAIEAALAAVEVIFPLAFVLEIAIGVVEFALPLHLALEPIPVVVAAVAIQVLALAMPQVVFLLARVHVAIGVQLAGVDLGPVLGGQ